MPFLVVFFALTIAVSSFAAEKVPNKLPSVLRVESSEPRKEVMKRLTLKEKKFAYYILEAGTTARSLLFWQQHRHGLLLRQVFVESLTAKNIHATKKLLGEEAFKEYLLYVAQFLDQSGPYGSNNRKSLLVKVQPEQMEALLDEYAPQVNENYYEQQIERATVISEVLQLLFDSKYEVLCRMEEDTDELNDMGGNLFEKGIKSFDVKSALDKTIKPIVSSRIVNSERGLKVENATVHTKRIVGDTLKSVVDSLNRAKMYAATEHQTKQIEKMVEFFYTGNEKDFRAMNVEWVQDRDRSTIDVMMGFVEYYQDPYARIGSWESKISVVDPEVSKQAQSFAKFAQYFEDQMPYGEYKKTFPESYSPPAIIAYYFFEHAASRSAGFNLPNYDDLRKKYGAKNVIKLDMPGQEKDMVLTRLNEEALKEFLPESKAREVIDNRARSRRIMTMLHEIIGHGSGHYDETKYPDQVDPVSVLGRLGSSLEEQRADLTALVFGADEKLVDIGLVADKKDLITVRNTMYDLYLADFLLRTSRLKNFSQTHTRGRWMFMNKLLKAGAIEWVARDEVSPLALENQVWIVKDYELFHKTAVATLEELQKIKATRLEADLKKLFDEFAPLSAIEAPWAKAIIKRGEKLQINAGYVEQPWSVTKDGDVEVYGGTTLESIAPYWKKYFGH